MATSSIGGLSSGLDTNSIIKQLMQIEALPQTALKNRQKTEQGFVDAIKSLSTKISDFKALASKYNTAATFSPLKVTSTSTFATAKTSPNSTPGDVTFTVNSLAKAHSLSFADSVAQTDFVTNGPTAVKLDYLDGTSKTIESGDGTLAGLVQALNASDTGVRATTVKLNDGSYRLNVTSTKPGASSDFALTNLDGSALLGGAAVTTGSDASITIGADTITSPTNTFLGLTNGMDITVSQGVALGTPITVTAETDSAPAKTAAKELVDGLNNLLAEFDKILDKSRTKGNSGAADSAIRSARQTFLTSVVGTDAALSAVGIETDRFGKVKFNEAKFEQAYAADPAAVAAKFLDNGAVKGFASRLVAAATSAIDPLTGTVSGSVKGREKRLDRLDKDIDAFTDRLARKQKFLEKQFAGLEVALSGIGAQANYLGAQLAGLNSNNS